MKLQRFFSLILILCITVCLLPGARAESTPSLEQAIIDACRYRQATDLSQLDIDCEEFKQVFDRLFCEGRLPWYTTNDYQYTYRKSNNTILTFTPTTSPADDEALITYEEKAAQVLKACVKEGMHQWQIALAIHDYLIVNSTYDSALEKNTPYDLLVNGTAVCTGYARVYQDLLLRAGIDCRYVVSESMKHAWNLVCIDNNWYHVDLTWDDPEPDIAGQVSHRYFLRTDEQMRNDEKPHLDWSTDITCTDTGFSDCYWKNANSAIWFEDNNTCYYMPAKKLSNQILARKENTTTESLLYSEKLQPLDIGYGDYLYEHYGLTLREDRLWYCTMTEIMSMKTDGTDRQTHYQKTGNVYIQGFFAAEDALQITLSDHNGNFTSDSMALPATGNHKCSFKRTVVAPTDTAPGYTLSQCDCGLEVKSLPTTISQPAEPADTVWDFFEGKIWIPAVVAAVVAGLGLAGRKRRK